MNNLLKLFVFSIVIAITQFSYAESQDKKLMEGMTLDNSLSSLNFVSIKKGTVGEVGEIHTFDKLSGSLSKDGDLIVKLDLSSIKTGIDVRDQRMREYLFETKDNATATISAKIVDIPTSGVSNHTGTLTLNLHGMKKDIKFQVLVVSSGNKLVVSSTKPIIIQASDFGLETGVLKLQELAKLPSISTVVPVNFVLIFSK